MRWSRIILLFNTALGDLDDAPFDFDRQRISSYSLSLEEAKDADRRTAKASELSNLLDEALDVIIRKNPIRASQLRDVVPEVRRRAHDVEVLKHLLSQIYVPVLERHIIEGPRIIYDVEFFFWESFRGAVESSLFHIYDEHLRELILNIHEAWGVSLSQDDYYRPLPHGEGHVFSNPLDMPFTAQQQAVWKRLEQAIRNLGDTWGELMRYVRESYLEVDPAQCSRTAHEAYQDHQRYIKEVFGE